MSGDEVEPHYHGHRQRLRERFLAAGAEALPDYELLELLLFGAIPRRDTKPLAKGLLAKFGSFADVINAEPAALREVDGVQDSVVSTLKLTQAAVLRVLRHQARERPVLGDWQKVLNYCQALMAHRKIEEFRLLFLDTRHALIADELQNTGTIDHTQAYPREIVKRALELNAAAIIMVHNHPSGDPTPSRADIEMTRQVEKAAAGLGVQLHDHLIIGANKHSSLKAMGLF